MQPDVVILDTSTPLFDGIEAATILNASGSKAKVIFLTVHDRVEFIHACFKAGAVGYVIKHSMATDLLTAVHEVLAGHQFISHFPFGTKSR